MRNVADTLLDPYPGVAPFQDRREDQLLFFGRKDEKEALLNMVLAERLSLLYSRSGIGKTSLINASLLEELRSRGFFPVVVRLTYDADAGPIASVYRGVQTEAERTSVTISGERGNNSLWEYFYSVRFLRDGLVLRPILIIDQFEELFTIIRTHTSEGDGWEQAFIKQLADLVRPRVPEEVRSAAMPKLETLSRDDPERQRILAVLYEGEGPDVKVLLSIREDFFPELETLESRIPGIFRNSYRLRPLNREQAHRAIEEPSKCKEALGDDTFTFAPGVVEEILDFLAMQRVGDRLFPGDAVEPVQLQILCQELNRRRRERGAPEITHTDLGGPRGMKRILVGYYHKVLKTSPRLRLGWNTRTYRPSLRNWILINRPRSALRNLCERGLLTSTDHRNSLSVEVIKHHYGVPERDLSRLANERLLSSEPRLGSFFYELSHDALVEPLLTSRRRRRITAAIILVGLIVLPLCVPTLVVLSRDIYQARERRSALAILANPGLSPAQRSTAVRTLVDTGYSNFEGLQLQRTDLRGLYAYSVKFNRADLQGARLDRASFRSANFSKANLLDASLADAMLERSNFSEAILSDADLSGANLRFSILEGAILERTNLKWADLRGAILSNAKIDGAKFEETEWWLAYGWTQEQIRELDSQWPHKSFATSDKYRAELRRLTQGVEMAKDNNQRSIALNERAWYRAIHGIELNEALQDATASLREKGDNYNAIDTRGYIYLQLGRYSEALADLDASFAAAEADKQPEPSLPSLGEFAYHLALAFDYLGDYDKAQTFFKKATQLNYRPTHELLLTPPK